VLKFFNIDSEYAHYKRTLTGNAPVEARAEYKGDRLYSESYSAHDGRFIVGAIFTRGHDRRSNKLDGFLGLLSRPVL
jgi:hypothetical protein